MWLPRATRLSRTIDWKQLWFVFAQQLLRLPAPNLRAVLVREQHDAHHLDFFVDT
jgi:hypothetical protein